MKNHLGTEWWLKEFHVNTFFTIRYMMVKYLHILRDNEKNLLASHENLNMWNGFWELIWKLTMSSCGRYFLLLMLLSLSLSLLIFDLFHKLGLRVHWKKSLIYTLFFGRIWAILMEWVSSQHQQQQQWEKPRQTGLRIEFTSGILHFSLFA